MTTDSTQRQTPLAGTEATLARRYAVALYELAADGQAVEAVAANLTQLRQTIAEVPELRRLITDPRVTHLQMTTALKAVGQNLLSTDLVQKFLALLAHNGRAVLLPQIIEAFAAEKARRAGEMTATVRVAAPLTAAQQAAIIQHLAAATGRKVSLHMQEDADLIGGMVVQFGSLQIDASLRGRLAALTQSLREAA